MKNKLSLIVQSNSADRSGFTSYVSVEYCVYIELNKNPIMSGFIFGGALGSKFELF